MKFDIVDFILLSVLLIPGILFLTTLDITYQDDWICNPKNRMWIGYVCTTIGTFSFIQVIRKLVKK